MHRAHQPQGERAGARILLVTGQHVGTRTAVAHVVGHVVEQPGVQGRAQLETGTRLPADPPNHVRRVATHTLSHAACTPRATVVR